MVGKILMPGNRVIICQKGDVAHLFVDSIEETPDKTIVIISGLVEKPFPVPREDIIRGETGWRVLSKQQG